MTPNYRMMLLGISMILFSIAVIIKSVHFNIPVWILNIGQLMPYVGIILCSIGFFFASEK